MINHIYGVVGITGTLIALITSFIQDKKISQWIFVCSGWLAAFLIGLFNYFIFKRLVTQVDSLIDKNNQVSNELSNIEHQKRNIESIAAYLATQNPSIPPTAKPRDNKSNNEFSGA
ncbi:TPA: protein gop [Providencia rettgeri]|uniref:protein gop n=1 Tax=Providencia sp. PROV129 TaxID=2949839 RepID=UPI00234B8D61|nr:protein gop [Providencia sp. PROV129]